MWNKKKFVMILLCLFFLNTVLVRASNGPEENTAAKEFLKNVITAYQEQSEVKLARYYSLENIEDSTVEFERVLFQSFQAEDVRIEGMECLLDKDGYLYMGANLSFRMKDESEMPYYEYFLLSRNSEGEYTAVPEEMYPLRLKRMISKKKQEWEQTELYVKYQEAADVYEISYPGYADTVYERLILLLNNCSKKKREKENLHMAGTIFIMGIVQLLLLCVWILQQDRYYD